MELTETRLEPFTVVAVSGKLDAASAPLLEEKLVELLEGGCTHLIIECSGLDYCSSAGVRVFIMAALELRDVNGKLGVAGMQPLIKDVFDMAGLMKVFEFFPAPADAVQALA